MFDEIELLEKNLDRQIGFVRASESRVSFMLPALTLTLAIWLFGFKNADASNGLAVLLGFLSLTGFIVACYFVWASMYPNTQGPKTSQIFFGSISSRTREQYSEEISQLDEAQYKADLISQIHVNASIATSKFSSVKYAMIFWYVSLVPLTLFVVISI